MATKVEREALEEINRIRRRRKLPLLHEIPKGGRRRARSCPIAVALDAYIVGPDYILWFKYDDQIPTPKPLARFLDQFDSGRLPQYEDKSRSF